MVAFVELEKDWEDGAEAYFKALHQPPPGGTETTTKPRQGHRCAGREPKQAPPEYKTHALPLEPNSSVQGKIRTGAKWHTIHCSEPLGSFKSRFLFSPSNYQPFQGKPCTMDIASMSEQFKKTKTDLTEV
jgi:hypothetical protein